MKSFYSVVIVALSLAMAACNDQQPQPQVQQYAPQQQVQQTGVPATNQPPVVYQQPPAEDHTLHDGLIGGGLGYMLARHTAGGGNSPANGGYSPGYSSTPVVNNTTVVKKVYVQQNVK